MNEAYSNLKSNPLTLETDEKESYLDKVEEMSAFDLAQAMVGLVGLEKTEQIIDFALEMQDFTSNRESVCEDCGKPYLECTCPCNCPVCEKQPKDNGSSNTEIIHLDGSGIFDYGCSRNKNEEDINMYPYYPKYICNFCEKEDTNLWTVHDDDDDDDDDNNVKYYHFNCLVKEYAKEEVKKQLEKKENE